MTQNIPSINPERPTSEPPYAASRSNVPEKEEHRRRFAQIQKIVERLSLPPHKKDEETGEYVLPLDKAAEMLEQNAKELTNRDPLIPLTMALKKAEWDPSVGDMRIGANRFISPSIKDLNDIYLGPNNTDNFIDELQQEIEKILGENKAKVLQSHFKGGSFIIDLEKIETAEGQEKVAALKERLNLFQETARKKLLKHLNLRKKELTRKRAELDQQILTIDEKLDQMPGNEEMIAIKKEQEKLAEENENLVANIRQVRQIIREIETGAKTVDITIGLGKLHPGKLENYAAINNAESGANIATLQKRDPSVLNGNGNGNGNGNSHHPETSEVYLREYKEEDLVYYGLKAILRTGREIIGPDYQIKEHWRKFFETEGGNILMGLGMIQLYRKLNEYRQSKEYGTRSDKEKAALEEQFAVFNRHYNSINIVDVLKNFRIENFDKYFEMIEMYVRHLEQCEEVLKAYQEGLEKGEVSPKDEDNLRTCLELSNEFLKYSLKTDHEVGEIVHTMHAVIEALMQPGQKVIVSADVKGVGPKNARSNEKKFIELIKKAGITPQDIRAIGGNSSKIRDLVNKKVAEAKKDPDFQKSILSFNDEITKELREVEAKFHSLFGKGKAVVANIGGDEILAVYTEENVEGIRGKTAQEILEVLKGFSVDEEVRIAVRIDDMTISPVPGVDTVTQENRRDFLRWIETMDSSATAHQRIKLREKEGKQPVLRIPFTHE